MGAGKARGARILANHQQLYFCKAELGDRFFNKSLRLIRVTIGKQVKVITNYLGRS